MSTPNDITLIALVGTVVAIASYWLGRYLGNRSGYLDGFTDGAFEGWFAKDRYQLERKMNDVMSNYV